MVSVRALTDDYLVSRLVDDQNRPIPEFVILIEQSFAVEYVLSGASQVGAVLRVSRRRWSMNVDFYFRFTFPPRLFGVDDSRERHVISRSPISTSAPTTAAGC